MTMALSLLLLCATVASAQVLGIGTSPQGTVTYAFGGALSKVLKEAANIESRVQPSTGTGAMIPLVNSGEIDIGFCNSLELYEAFHGTGTFDKRPNPKLRTIAVLFPLRVGLFVRNDSPIKSLKDLKGRTISYGYTGQEIIRTTVDAMLANAGLSISDMKPVLVPNLIRGVDEFIAGRVDVTTFAIGGAKVAEADAAVGGIRYLDLDPSPEAVQRMQKVFRTSYMDKVSPAPNLPGVRETINTMHYDYTVFANADVPPERVKTIARVIAEQKPALAQSAPQFQGLKVERLYTNVDVPFHPGAVAYFEEKGIKPSK
jgi:TRAP transporter TAXI family solute receptor